MANKHQNINVFSGKQAPDYQCTRYRASTSISMYWVASKHQNVNVLGDEQAQDYQCFGGKLAPEQQCFSSQTSARILMF